MPEKIALDRRGTVLGAALTPADDVSVGYAKALKAIKAKLGKQPDDTETRTLVVA